MPDGYILSPETYNAVREIIRREVEDATKRTQVGYRLDPARSWHHVECGSPVADVKKDPSYGPSDPKWKLYSGRVVEIFTRDRNNSMTLGFGADLPCFLVDLNGGELSVGTIYLARAYGDYDTGLDERPVFGAVKGFKGKYVKNVQCVSGSLQVTQGD